MMATETGVFEDGAHETLKTFVEVVWLTIEPVPVDNW